MKIGLFDHIEHGDRPLSTLFDERLKFFEAADAAGFYCLQLAEHHATPLNMVPVPGVFPWCRRARYQADAARAAGLFVAAVFAAAA